MAEWRPHEWRHAVDRVDPDNTPPVVPPTWLTRCRSFGMRKWEALKYLRRLLLWCLAFALAAALIRPVLSGGPGGPGQDPRNRDVAGPAPTASLGHSGRPGRPAATPRAQDPAKPPTPTSPPPRPAPSTSWSTPRHGAVAISAARDGTLFLRSVTGGCVWSVGGLVVTVEPGAERAIRLRDLADQTSPLLLSGLGETVDSCLYAVGGQAATAAGRAPTTRSTTVRPSPSPRSPQADPPSAEPSACPSLLDMLGLGKALCDPAEE